MTHLPPRGSPAAGVMASSSAVHPAAPASSSAIPLWRRTPRNPRWMLGSPPGSAPQRTIQMWGRAELAAAATANAAESRSVVGLAGQNRYQLIPLTVR